MSTVEFAKAIQNAGLKAPVEIIADGKIHRFNASDKRSDDSGWYVLHLDGVAAGAFGCWRQGFQQTWSSKSEDAMNALEIARHRDRMDLMRAQREDEQAARFARAAILAGQRWSSATQAVDHPYLSTKGINGYGTKVLGDLLLVPVYDISCSITSLQTISADGQKRFQKDGRIAGGFHVIGIPDNEAVICEGYATGASIHMATGLPVIVAFNAGNLMEVAISWHKARPKMDITVAADDDWKTEGNPGLTKAKAAATAVNAKLATPSFPDGRPDKATDFNDLHALAGLDAVAQCFGNRRMAADGFTKLVRDPIELASLLETIDDCADLEALREHVIPAIKKARGIDVDDSRTLAKALKRKTNELGGDIGIAQARVICVTEEQAAIDLNRKTVASAVAAMTGVSDSRPVLQQNAGHLHTLARECAAELYEEVFYRGRHVVRLSDGPEGKEVVRCSPQWLARELTQRLKFSTADGDPADCGERLAQVVASGGADDFYLPLAGVARAPFLREDGTICHKRGYDHATALWLESDLAFPQIPENPSKQQALDAREKLLDLVCNFPFADETNRAAWLADLLGAVARPTLPTLPVVVYTAPMPGTGKTLLAEVVNLIAYGQTYLFNWLSSEDELRKQLTAALDKGDSFIGFDNVPNGLAIKSAVLAQFATNANYQDRRLGSTERVRYANRMRMMLTGNNINLAADNARRGITVALDLNADSPRGRTFKISNLRSHVIRHRGELLACALTILRAYHLATDKPKLQVLESFEDWSERVQGAVIWLGLSDPVATVKFDDDGVGELGYAFSKIHAAMEFMPDYWRAGKLAETIASREGLKASLLDVDCQDPTNAKILGHWLKSNMNRVAGGYKLVCQRDSHTKNLTWAVKVHAHTPKEEKS